MSKRRLIVEKKVPVRRLNFMTNFRAGKGSADSVYVIVNGEHKLTPDNIKDFKLRLLLDNSVVSLHKAKGYGNIIVNHKKPGAMPGYSDDDDKRVTWLIDYDEREERIVFDYKSYEKHYKEHGRNIFKKFLK